MSVTSLLEVFINRVPGETRLAFTEDGRLKDLIITCDDDESLIGNIYLGRVEKVVAGLNAAFIGIGRSVSGFLAANDGQIFDLNKEKPKLINTLFKEGDAVLVQVTRDESDRKGAKLTTRIDLVGRTVVAVLGRTGVSISKSVSDKVHRERLRSALEDLETSIAGLIVRTNAQFVSSEDLQKEAENLLDQVLKINSGQKRIKPPACLYKQSDQILNFLRDFGSADWRRIVIDDRAALMRITEYVSDYVPELEKIFKFADDPVALFDNYDLEQQIANLFEPTIALPSGGRLIIEETEALVAVDVDSGKHDRDRNPESFALSVNEEAAIELTRQLVLRNLSGQIVIDFLPMKRKKNREYIQTILSNLLVKVGDCNIYGFSRLGLLEMTRQRIGESLLSRFLEKKGHAKTVRAIVIDMIRAVLREINRNPGKRLTVVCSHTIYVCLKGDMKIIWAELLERTGPIISLEEFSGSPQDHFEFRMV